MRPRFAFISRPQGGRGECRVPAAPAASRALWIGRTHTSNNEYTGTPGIPARNGFTAYFVLSPVTGLFCHRRPRIGFVQARLGRRNSANLTPASGRQDHTTSPYAATSLVRSLGDRSRAHRPPCHPVARKTLPRPPHPHPASVTIAIRPSCGVGWREFVEMICPTGEAKYFCKWDSTQKCPTGKSPAANHSFVQLSWRGSARKIRSGEQSRGLPPRPRFAAAGGAANRMFGLWEPLMTEERREKTNGDEDVAGPRRMLNEKQVLKSRS